MELTSTPEAALRNFTAVRGKLVEEFDAARSSEKREAVLAMFKAFMDMAEDLLAKGNDKEALEHLREARSQDYDRLLCKESTVDGTLQGALSPELIMRVTNREIAAGRMAPDYSLRQLALKLAGSPHPSHSELLAQAEAQKGADLVIERLIHELKTPGGFDLPDARESIGKAFDAAVTSEQRGRVLAIFKATMDLAERNLAARGDQAELLARIREAREEDYKLFICQECTVGLDTPVVGGDFSVDMLMGVTNREIAAGRMTEDHPTRKMAVELAAAPHPSHAELVAEHARLKEQARQAEAASAPQPPAGNAEQAYAFGAVLGKKFKGLFRK